MPDDYSLFPPNYQYIINIGNKHGDLIATNLGYTMTMWGGAVRRLLPFERCHRARLLPSSQRRLFLGGW